jgi:hypothetical protein
LIIKKKRIDFSVWGKINIGSIFLYRQNLYFIFNKVKLVYYTWWVGGGWVRNHNNHTTTYTHIYFSIQAFLSEVGEPDEIYMMKVYDIRTISETSQRWNVSK